jgi:fatty-acyl-CoA synthase
VLRPFRKTAGSLLSHTRDVMIGSQLTINATRYANATALVFGAHRFSYATLNERACRLANGLAALGVAGGDHVASLINNCNHFAEIFLL